MSNLVIVVNPRIHPALVIRTDVQPGVDVGLVAPAQEDGFAATGERGRVLCVAPVEGEVQIAAPRV